MKSLSEIKGDIKKLESKITDLEHEENRARLSLLKAKSAVQDVQKEIDTLQQKKRKADEDVKEITEEQVEMSREKTELTRKLAGLQSEAMQAEADEHSKKK